MENEYRRKENLETNKRISETVVELEKLAAKYTNL
jgi:hypothetical protein